MFSASPCSTGRSSVTAWLMALLVRHPALRPAVDVDDRAAQVGTLLGQRVLDPWRQVRHAAAVDQPLVLEQLQALRERRRVRAAERVLQLAEALCLRAERADDAQHPLLAEHVERRGGGAFGTLRGRTP